jgi:hypothetical protein
LSRGKWLLPKLWTPVLAFWTDELLSGYRILWFLGWVLKGEDAVCSTVREKEPWSILFPIIKAECNHMAILIAECGLALGICQHCFKCLIVLIHFVLFKTRRGRGKWRQRKLKNCQESWNEEEVGVKWQFGGIYMFFPFF